TWLSGITAAQMELSYKIYREESGGDTSTLLAEGYTKLVCIDENLRAKRIPDKIRNILPLEDVSGT
ncbi:MAG: hypothetical protein J3T61_11710, partial [Candidatus Brocadiales bacterium]|nr:hypothetical protein [Candidatus Bathyanammoxibius sp.]